MSRGQTGAGKISAKAAAAWAFRRSHLPRKRHAGGRGQSEFIEKELRAFALAGAHASRATDARRGLAELAYPGSTVPRPIQMTDLPVPHNSRDPAHAVQLMLRSTHDRCALAPIKRASEEGVFPAASVLRKPRPVVGDTRWLAQDIAYACRNNQRTVLVNAANEQIIRLFCSAHVVDEIFEHHKVWSADAKRRVSSEDFLQRYVTEYLPLIRVVPDDGVPESWLSPSEQQRLATLGLSDTDDFPSVKLALAIRGLYLSKDKPALRAVYGAESQLAKHAEWLERLRAGGNAAELEQLMDSTNRFTALSGYGIFKGVQRAYDALGPLSILLGAAGAYFAWQWLSDASRQGLRDGFGRFVEFSAEVMTQQRAYEQQFDAALPAVPALRQLAAHASADAVLGRACLYALAREPEGHQSAQELAEQVRRQLPCADAQVRAIMREVPTFSEVYRGRWQVGYDQSRALLAMPARATAGR